jgi:hypothetical protein
MALGRALLHDIGVEPSGLAHLTEVATVVKALDEFGAFLDDGQTEFVPYWRTGLLVRYGEEFKADDAFTLTKENPLSRVYLSLWRRPQDRGFKSLIAIVNESDKPTREQLYVFDLARLFGGPNALDARAIIEGWNMSAIPGNSDWSKPRLQDLVLSHGGPPRTLPISLLDMTDRGYVRQARAEKDLEVYGPVHIPPRSFRLLCGAGRPR